MPMRSLWALALFGLVALTLALTACAQATPTPTPEPTCTFTPTTTISKAEAVARAVERARFCGMEDDPTGYAVRYMTLGEYCQLAGCGGPNPETPVWVVSLSTHYEDRCPEPLPCLVELYVVVVDAETGNVIGTRASCHANDSPFPVP